MTEQAPTDQGCQHCRWWRKINAVIGECRRMPPHPADNLEDPRWWPVTKRDDWCGELLAPDEQGVSDG